MAPPEREVVAPLKLYTYSKQPRGGLLYGLCGLTGLLSHCRSTIRIVNINYDCATIGG